MSDKKFGYVYCIAGRRTSRNRKIQVYTGSSVNPFHRLRQHRDFIAGGAKSTRKLGKRQRIFMLIAGFESPGLAQSFEYAMKSQKVRSSGVIGRARTLIKLLNHRKLKKSYKGVLWITPQTPITIYIDMKESKFRKMVDRTVTPLPPKGIFIFTDNIPHHILLGMRTGKKVDNDGYNEVSLK